MFLRKASKKNTYNLKDYSQGIEHHAWVYSLFDSDGAFYEDVQNFLAGGPLTSNLKTLAGRLMMVPTVERSVERLHRYTTLATQVAPHHGPAYVSSSLRVSEMEKFIHGRPAFLEELGAKCEITRKWHRCSRALGMSSHPLLQNIQNRFTFRRTMSMLCYRADARVQYERYPRIAKLIGQAQEQIATERCEQAQRPTDHPEYVQAKYAMQHLQEQACMDKIYVLRKRDARPQSLVALMEKPRADLRILFRGDTDDEGSFLDPQHPGPEVEVPPEALAIVPVEGPDLAAPVVPLDQSIAFQVLQK